MTKLSSPIYRVANQNVFPAISSQNLRFSMAPSIAPSRMDGFERHHRLMFGSLKSPNDFEREVAVRYTPSELLRISMTPDNFLGRGNKMWVYTIPGFPDYAWRIPKSGVKVGGCFYVESACPVK